MCFHDDKWNYHKLLFFRAIVTAWIIIVTTAIPVAIVHGVVNYPYNGRNYTACLFLVEHGYNLVLFQVIIFSCSVFSIAKEKFAQMIIIRDEWAHNIFSHLLEKYPLQHCVLFPHFETGSKLFRLVFTPNLMQIYAYVLVVSRGQEAPILQKCRSFRGIRFHFIWWLQ